MYRENTGPFVTDDLVGLLAIDLSYLVYYPGSKRHYLEKLLEDVNWEWLEGQYVNSVSDFEMQLGSGKCSPPVVDVPFMESEVTARVSIPKRVRKTNFKDLQKKGNREEFIRNLREQRDVWVEETLTLNRLLDANPSRVERVLEALDESAPRLLGEEDGEALPMVDKDLENMIYLGQRFLLFEKFFTSLSSDPLPPSGDLGTVLRNKYEQKQFFSKAFNTYNAASASGFFAVCWDCSDIHLVHRIPLQEPEVPGCVDILAIPLGEEIHLGLGVTEGEQNQKQFFRNIWRAVSWQEVGRRFDSTQC